jgi:uncharacterized protein YcfJ
MPIEGMQTMMTRTSTGLAAAALLAACGVAQAAEYARVVSSTPITESVTVPRQECVQGQQLVQQPPSGAGAVIGAIAGGVLGNQFGHGFGRAAATGAGAVAGAAFGNSVEAGANPPAAVPVQSCRTVNAQENRVVAYDVVYEYHGQRYATRLPQDPGARLEVDVRPATNSAPVERIGATGSYGAVPPASYGAPATYGAVPPAYAETAPVVTDPSPVVYATRPAVYAPAPVVYPAPYYYAAPVIGFGIGYWAGRAWHGGGHWHGGGWHGHRWR